MYRTKENVFRYSNERSIVLSDDIDRSSSGDVASDILHFNRRDAQKRKEDKKYTPEPIRLFIQSYGGCIYDAWGLIGVMEASKTPVYTYCYGYAMSAAFLVFLAGHRRFAGRYATFLYHQLSLWEYGRYQDVIEENDEAKWLQKRMEEYVSKRTKLNRKKLKDIRKTKKELYIHADQFLALGVADEIISENHSSRRKAYDKKTV